MGEKYQGLTMEIEQLATEIKESEEYVEQEGLLIVEFSKTLEEQVKKCDVAKAQIDQIKSQIKEQRDLIAERDSAIQAQKQEEKQTIKDIKG
jgi:methyl-accepting chemotaxis protein